MCSVFLCLLGSRTVSLAIKEELIVWLAAYLERSRSFPSDSCLCRQLARFCNRAPVFIFNVWPSTSQLELIQIYFCSPTAEFDSWLNAKQTAEVIFANPFLFTTSSLVVLADVTAHGDLEWESEREGRRERERCGNYLGGTTICPDIFLLGAIFICSKIPEVSTSYRHRWQDKSMPFQPLEVIRTNGVHQLLTSHEVSPNHHGDLN